MRTPDVMRQWVATLLCWTCAAPLAWAQVPQDQALAPVRPTSSIMVRPYQAVYVPPANLTNSQRLASLVRAGKLYLTVQDAIALVLENNIDVEVARITPVMDQWQLERSQAGGALPGVPSASSLGSTVTRGQGVRGSQSAAGVSTSGGGGSANSTANATITQIGAVTPTLDPVFQDTTSFSHLSLPQSNLSFGVVNLIDKQRNYSTSLQKGFLTGTNVSINYSEGYLNENSPTDALNPQYAPSISATISQPFLQGFGVAVNGRTINVDKVNLKIDDLNFKSEVITVVVNVLNLYYGLVADYQDLKAKRSAVDVAQQFYENNKKQVQLGALAPLDVTTAEAQVASSQLDMVTAQGTLAQQQISLKNVLSRTGTADPVLANVEIIPLDRIDVPEKEDLPPMKDLVQKALANRVDIAAVKMHLQVDALDPLGTKNGLLPTLSGRLQLENQGQAGAPQFVDRGPLPAGFQGPLPPGFVTCPSNSRDVCEVPNKYFVGGIGNALGQVFRRDFPSETATAFLFASLRNRAAQADYVIDRVGTRQDQLQLQKNINQMAVDVSNQVTGLQQARVRYLAATKNRVLEEQLLDAEQKKFGLGASVPFNVVTQQRDLATAQSTEVAALVAYSNALIGLGQTLGTTLDDVHVSINEAKSGIVTRQSTLPAELPAQP